MLFRQTCFSVSINEMIKRLPIAGWLRRRPMANCEMWTAGKELFRFVARFL